MTKDNFLVTLNEHIKRYSLLQHVLSFDTQVSACYEKTFTGIVPKQDLRRIVRKKDLILDREFVLLASIELMMVLPERHFFKEAGNRCTTSIEEIVNTSSRGESGTVILPRHRIEDLPKNFSAVSEEETHKSNLLGTLDNLKIFTDSHREPEHLVFGFDDLYMILDKDKQAYSTTNITLKGDKLQRSVSFPNLRLN